MTELRAGAACVPLNLPGWPETTDGTPLVARCLVLDDGQTPLALVSLTVVALTVPDAGTIRAAVAEAVGLPVGQVLVACTHVHTGPPTFTAAPTERTDPVARIAAAAATAASEAQGALAPAQARLGLGRLPGVSRVRRILRRDGSVITLRRSCPETWDWASDRETIGPDEPLDDRLTVLGLWDAAGILRAAVLHFTCHPIPDFLGYAARALEQAHPGAVCLLLNGCSGTVDTPFEQPMAGKVQQEQLPLLGEALTQKAEELLAAAGDFPVGRLAAVSRPVTLPLDPRFVAEAGFSGDLWADVRAAGEFVAAVQVLRLGDLALACVPGEPHVGFGPQVEMTSPFPLTRVVGLANGETGYLLPAAMRARGGYEADPSYWGVVDGQGLEVIRGALAACLDELQ